ncbi:MAG: TetR/AcrR family transcriptional regulator [Hyphomicrobiaceae bacterium]|nr:TetR/AcrR family transcriptional regulator [Hyphomicrobiaceae bacterium]
MAGKPRSAQQAARRDEILKAALAEFAAHGFEAARLDDVAKRAGVAKGTLYLYFADKTALFEELVRTAAAPVIERLADLSEAPDVPAPLLLATFFEVFRTQVLGTDRKLLLRLVLSEGPRFPEIAAFYHANVVSRGMALLRKVIARGVARGEIKNAALEQYPQLVMAPALVALVWDGLFQTLEPIDIAEMLKTHIDLLTQSPTRYPPPTDPERSLP